MWVRKIFAGLVVMALCVGIPLLARGDDRLAVFIGDKIVEMPREKYLVGVVAAEMPASYEVEALKAQAVAARTRTLGGCLSHHQADVCGDSACCQGYLDEEAQVARWGEDTEQYRARIEAAVNATQGIIILYEDKPIEVLYHAVSGGHTEDVEQVYGMALPYLRGVVSPGEENASRYETVQEFTQETLAAAFPGMAGPIALEVLERSESGRVLRVLVGGHEMTGRLFRSALGLKSTNFVIEQDADGVRIWQRGYGHGVGMSQAGANAMAKSGVTFREILLHYYTGVVLGTLAE